jgi:septal ring factor EnvC (AmiA/AmiB activator)
MRLLRTILTLATLIIAVFPVTPARGQNTAQERAANLRQQLAEVQTQQAELQTRLQQLEEDLKPENIEKGLAGIGSTRPEELRDQRRRQLEIERKSVQTQLEQLATRRTRLETWIAQADADAYHRSAVVNRGETPQPTSAQPGTVNSATVQRRTRRGNKNRPRPRRLRRFVQHAN